jgi:hypothetical protein
LRTQLAGRKLMAFSPSIAIRAHLVPKFRRKVSIVGAERPVLG